MHDVTKEDIQAHEAYIADRVKQWKAIEKDIEDKAKRLFEMQENCKHEMEVIVDPVYGGSVATCTICGHVECG